MKRYKLARKNIANLIDVNPSTLTYVLYVEKIDQSYKIINIPKKSGGTRDICVPSPQLKSVQKKLANMLCNKHSEYVVYNNINQAVSHGFERKRSIITNASNHKNKKYLLNVDISDFFDSFHFGRVKGFFKKNRNFAFSEEEATIIAQLSCYKGKLPQGAPTSPIIANLIFNIVDLHILKLAKKYRVYYTRYADDLSFSTDMNKFKNMVSSFLKELKLLLEKHGFELNDEKTRLQTRECRQEVTGVTVNEKLNPCPIFVRKTRAMADRLYKTGDIYFEGCADDEDISLKKKRLEGRFCFINQFDAFNNMIEYGHNNSKLYNKHQAKLNKREIQYQRFLFYKHFYNPDAPLLVTEGITDIIHIESALMKHYIRYPRLVTKTEKGFEFNFKFLNRTDKLKFFFGISEDGADTMVNIYNYYSGTNCRNIDKILEKKLSSKQSRGTRNPVILIFDNEQKGNKKPLKKFLNYSRKKLDCNLYSRICSNLYLQTIPLVNNKDECEIEDLYSEDLLSIKIKGKTFSKKTNENSENYFGKSRFADFIKNNYSDINFDNFIPLLDCINEIIEGNKQI